LIQLIPEAKQAFYEDKLTVAHAFEIARLQPLCGGAIDVALSIRGYRKRSYSVGGAPHK